MYQLLVVFPNESTPRITASINNASEVLHVVTKLLDTHRGCERTVVMMGSTRLFAIDCQGNSLP